MNHRTLVRMHHRTPSMVKSATSTLVVVRLGASHGPDGDSDAIARLLSDVLAAL
ncbi:MAG: hypothetical protein QNK03_12490 [Myxococcota bacterium]|nr:hypothetical protein [Myxococcota bacterium]